MSSFRIGRVCTSTIIRKTSKLSLRAVHSMKHLNASYDYIKAEVRENGVGLITLNRPKSLNAISEGIYIYVYVFFYVYLYTLACIYIYI